MSRGWQVCRRKSETWRRRAPRNASNFYTSRLLVEALEDRRLLTTASDVEVDSSYVPTSLIVQFRDGASSAGSLAAYSAGNLVGDGWAIAPGVREVQLNEGAD